MSLYYPPALIQTIKESCATDELIAVLMFDTRLVRSADIPEDKRDEVWDKSIRAFNLVLQKSQEQFHRELFDIIEDTKVCVGLDTEGK